MQRILITPPDEDVISLSDIKAHLRYEDDDQDALIQALLGAVISLIDPAAGGGLGRALRPQTWELQLDGFPRICDRRDDEDRLCIELPFPPLISVVSVTYVDLSGSEQTLTEGSGFEVVGLGGRGKQSIVPPYLAWWPLARCHPGSVKIRFQAGYPTPGEDETDTLPAGIIAAIKLYVGHLFANREAVTDGRINQPFEVPWGYTALLDPHRAF